MSELLLCPTCLHVTPAAVSLPCGHSFCLPCLQTMDQGLDRHCCPQCRQEYHPRHDYCYGNSDNEAQFIKTDEEMGLECLGNVKMSGFQNKVPLLSDTLREDERRRCNSTEVVHQNASGNSQFLDKSSLSMDSELHHNQRSETVCSEYNMAPNVTENVSREDDTTRRGVQNLPTDERHNEEINKATGGEIERSGETLALLNKSPISEEDERKMEESKLKLAAQVTDLTLELKKAESLMKEEQQFELNVIAANAKLRQSAAEAVGDVTSFAQNFSEQVLKLIEEELNPGEAALRDRVANASKRTDQLKRATQDAEELLKGQDPRVFNSKVQSVESEIGRCNGVKQIEEVQEVKFDLTKLCPELERLHCEFRDKLERVRRSLRSAFNPSEVTFDPETLHPNLVLSDDMKTVTFSAKKQQYAPSPKRFTSFFQALSLQAFHSGVHRWELEVEGAPWMLGVCAASALPRAGLRSALETCPTSWALMWNNNLLTALERSRTAPLKKTPEASRRLRLELDLEGRVLAFHHLSASGESTLIHRCCIDTEEPLHLAYRMLSGDAKGRLTVRS